VWPRRYLLLLLVPFVLVAAGTLGYWLIEGWTPFDALYMTVITLTTVGYGETHPLSTAGRAFTIVLLLGGVFVLLFAATEVIRAVVSGEVQAALGKQLMERNLAELKDHIIICGYGRMGRAVAKEFSVAGEPFVIVDRDEAALKDFDLPHGLALPGDATFDDTLRKAGVPRARALVTVTASDADNLYITLSARLLNDKVFIVARTDTHPAEQKLIRAGANRVVSPHATGGFRVAQAVLRPTVVDFIELATRTEHLELQIEESQVAPNSPLVGANLRDSRLRQDRGIIIVAMKKASGEMVYNPPAEAVMEAGDILITLGHRKQVDRLDALAQGRLGMEGASAP
jgi:voltage-gated potassium channel